MPGCFLDEIGHTVAIVIVVVIAVVMVLLIVIVIAIVIVLGVFTGGKGRKGPPSYVGLNYIAKTLPYCENLPFFALRRAYALPDLSSSFFFNT